MKLARYKLGDNAPAYGLIRGENIYEVKGDIFSEYAPTGNQYPLSQVKLLAPVTPSIIAAVGKNYYDHALEFDNTLPESPIIFFKPPTSVIGPEDAIVRPFISTRVDYEGELAMVVKKTARCVDAADYKDYILGYTILNDVTARDLQCKDGQWARAKGFDTFAPIGPVITDEVDASSLRIETLLNGTTVQSSSTSKLLFSLGQVFEFITRFMTLRPGDVIATGTPEGVGPMSSGDVVEVRIEGIGSLRNTVVDEA